jgi:dihydroorotate dehydrogenase (NAD+) catalytic subunit
LVNLRLENPTILASGILGLRAAILKKVVENGAGAVITKSIGLTPRSGYNTPNVIEPLPGVVLNAMGLPNPGCSAFKAEIEAAKEIGVPVIVSIFGRTSNEFVKVALEMEKAGADMLEINVSCPHIENRHLIGQDPERTHEVVKKVYSAIKIPIMVKLTPNVTDITIIAEAAIKAGAKAISAINTVKALYIDVDRCSPLLSNKVGGMSGPSIKPIAVRCVAEIALLIQKKRYNVTLVGVGGVYSGRDAIEFIMAGASAVQVGTAILHYGLGVFKKIVKEIEEFMRENDYNTIEQMRGKALGEVQKCSSMTL